VRLDRWLEHHGGSPLPLVDEDIWRKSLRPRHRPVPPPPPSALVIAEDWTPGDDPHVRELEEARARLVERLIAAGSAAALGTLESFDELRLLASFLWLPRDSAPLRRLGLRIQAPGPGMMARAMLRGPSFEVELDNYRFSSTNAAKQQAAVAARAARQPEHARQQTPQDRPRVATAVALQQPVPVPPPVPSTTPLTRPTAPLPPAATHPLEDLDPLATRPLPAIDLAAAPPLRPARPPEPAAPTGGRRLWPFGRRSQQPSQPTQRRNE